MFFSSPHDGRLIRPLVFVSHKEHIRARLDMFFFMRYRLRFLDSVVVSIKRVLSLVRLLHQTGGEEIDRARISHCAYTCDINARKYKTNFLRMKKKVNEKATYSFVVSFLENLLKFTLKCFQNISYFRVYERHECARAHRAF